MKLSMPYKSKAQAAYMHSQHPDIAARWDAESKQPHKGKVKAAARKAFGGRTSK